MTTITQQRQKWAAVKGAPSIRRREQWGARFDYTRNRYTVTEPATRWFVHITVTNPRNYASNDAHARAVESIGISRFPSTGISYSFGVMPDGSLYEFQPIGRQGAHTVNDFKRSTCTTSGCPGRGTSLTAPSWNLNVNARAIVICQNVGDPVSDKQVDTIARATVACYLAGFITWSAAHNCHGHRCVSSKSCPGDRMWARMSNLHTLIHRYRDNGLPGGSTPPPPPAPPPPPPPPKEDDVSEQDVINGIKKAFESAAARESPYGRQLGNAIRDALVAAGFHNNTALAVWQRENPTLGLQYGTVARYDMNATRPDRSQTPGARVGLLQDLDRIEEGQQAVLAAVLSQGDLETVRQAMDSHHAEVIAQGERAEAALQELAVRIDEISEASERRDREALDMLDDALSGRRDATETLRALRDLIDTAVGAPEEQ